MINYRTYIYTLPVVILLVCCKPQGHQLKVLEQAEQYLNTHQDSARLLFDEIKPARLNPELTARYSLLTYRLKYRELTEHQADSLLTIAEDYYRNTRDTAQLALTLSYKGDKSSLHNNPPAAEKYYTDVLDMWLAQGDSARIARAYIQLGRWASGVQRRDSALTLTHQALRIAPAHLQTWVLSIMGNMHQEHGAPDSAMHYFARAFDQTQEIHERQTIRNRMYHTRMSQGKFEEAFHQLDTFLTIKRSRTATAYGMLATGHVWMGVHRYDSALHYYTLASQSTNTYVATEAYRLLAQLNALLGRYETAVNQSQTSESLWSDTYLRVQREDMSSRFEQMKLKNELNEIKLAKRNREMYLLLLVATTILCLITAYIIYLRNKRRKEKQHFKQQAEWLEKENKLLKQAEELSNLREKEASLREALFRKMSVFHKIPSLDNNTDKAAHEHRIVLSEKDWEDVVQIVDSSYEGFAHRLAEAFPLLTPKDIRFCCLVKINVTLKDLSDIYCVGKAAITKKKFRIKTEKIGFKDEDKSLDDFLEAF